MYAMLRMACADLSLSGGDSRVPRAQNPKNLHFQLRQTGKPAQAVSDWFIPSLKPIEVCLGQISCPADLDRPIAPVLESDCNDAYLHKAQVRGVLFDLERLMAPIFCIRVSHERLELGLIACLVAY